MVIPSSTSPSPPGSSCTTRTAPTSLKQEPILHSETELTPSISSTIASKPEHSILTTCTSKSSVQIDNSSRHHAIRLARRKRDLRIAQRAQVEEQLLRNDAGIAELELRIATAVSRFLARTRNRGASMRGNQSKSNRTKTK